MEPFGEFRLPGKPLFSLKTTLFPLKSLLKDDESLRACDLDFTENPLIKQDLVQLFGNKERPLLC